MRTRTRLTSPPGEEPTADEAIETRTPERYSPALALPEEPDVPGRFRRVLVTVGVLALLALVGWGLLRLASAGQAEDPALDEAPAVDEVEPTAVPTAGPTG
jgi:hypothetical protein